MKGRRGFTIAITGLGSRRICTCIKKNKTDQIRWDVHQSDGK